MIYCFYGTDTVKTRKATHLLIDATQKKKPDASFFHMTTQNWGEGEFKELLESAGLFHKKYIVLLDHLLEDGDVRKVVAKNIKEMAGAEHLFVILEDSIDKKTLTKIEKYAHKVVVYNATKKVAPKENDFALANAIEKKDKKKAWVLLSSAFDRGVRPDILHGMIFWKVKTMVLKSQTYTYSEQELRRLLSDLVTMHHRARTGKTDMSIALEKFVLSL